MLKTRRPVYKWLFIATNCMLCADQKGDVYQTCQHSMFSPIGAWCTAGAVEWWFQRFAYRLSLLPFPQTDVACSQATWLPWKASLQSSLLREWVISELPLRLTSVSQHRKVQRHWYENNGFILMQIKVIITSFCTYKPHLKGNWAFGTQKWPMVSKNMANWKNSSSQKCDHSKCKCVINWVSPYKNQRTTNMVVLKIWNLPGCCKQEPVQNPPNQSFERNENGTKMF